jgi:hypothetical protein
MRKVMALLAAFGIALGLAVVASAHDRHGFGHRNRGHFVRRYPVSRVRVVRVQRPVRVLGARYYRYDYGRRRGAFVQQRNFERRALRRHWIMEHRRARRHHRVFIHH